MSFLELAESRYSVRDFSSREVSDEIIGKILDAARLAPTAVNYQPQHLYVVKSPEAVAKLNGLRALYGAPLAIIVCYDENIVWKNSRSGKDSGDTDTAIVTTHMMLEAWEQGVGSCWMCAFSPKDVREAFEIPAGIEPVHILALGYPSDSCRPSERHTIYRPDEETVSFI